MATTARDTSLKLRPDLAIKVAPRAARFNLTVSAYVGILVWNQAQRPFPLAVEPGSKKLARVNVPCYLRCAIAPLLKRIASEYSLSENAAAEALIARDLASGEATLAILSRKR